MPKISTPRAFAAIFILGAATFAIAAPFLPIQSAPFQATQPAVSRPQYAIRASVDTELLTLRGAATVRVPVKSGDPVSDAVFFLYANADGVGGADAKRKNLVVNGVSLDGKAVPFSLSGAVLRVKLPAQQDTAFDLKISFHGLVPRAPESKGAMGGMLGADIDLGALLGGMGGDTGGAKPKAKNADYGLYTFGDGILSLGSFWYPQLAVREKGRWADSAPEGLGDVAFSEKSDFDVSLELPASWKVVGPGNVTRSGNTVSIRAQNVRECAVMASEEYLVRAKNFVVGGKNVRVESYATNEGAPKMDEALEVAGRSLQVFAKRFGPYPYDNFKVAQAPLRGGAGGMEYSGLTGIASMLYQDMGKQLGGLATSLNLPGASDLLRGMELEGGELPKEKAGAGGIQDLLGGVLGGQKEMLESMLETTIAHEVAHQWWAIGVGSDSQNHPFVDEALTNWSAMLYYEDRYGKEKAAQQIELNLKTTFSMGAMMGGGDKPANLRTADYSGNLQYGAVIYGKAAYFYTQLRTLVGDEAFFRALQTYYAQYSGKIAGANSLRAIFEAQNPAKKAQIGALYARWIEGAHGQEDLGTGIGGLDLGGLLGGLMGGLGGTDGN